MGGSPESRAGRQGEVSKLKGEGSIVLGQGVARERQVPRTPLSGEIYESSSRWWETNEGSNTTGEVIKGTRRNHHPEDITAALADSEGRSGRTRPPGVGSSPAAKVWRFMHYMDDRPRGTAVSSDATVPTEVVIMNASQSSSTIPMESRSGSRNSSGSDGQKSDTK